MKKLISICFVLFFISFVVAEPINLARMDVNTTDVWNLDKKTYIYVYTKNVNDTLIDIDTISIDLLNNISFEQQRKIYRTDVGTYKKYFIINETENVSILYFNITAVEKVKTINKVINVSLVQETGIRLLYSTSTKYVMNTWTMFKDSVFEYWLLLIILVCVSLAILVFVDLFLRRQR